MGALIRRRHVATAGPTRRDISRSISNGQDRQLADLAEVGFLAECTRQQRERIASLSVTLEVSAGRRLCHASGSDRQFLAIVKGEATVTFDCADVATLGPVCGFGTVAVLTLEGRRAAAVTAATPMTLLVLHPGEFDTLARDVPGLARRVQHETACRLAHATANNTQQAPRRHSLGLAVW